MPLRSNAQTSDVVVLAMEYRGYGRSENGGGFSEPAFVEDAAAAYEWLVTYATSENSVVDPSRILVFGRSLGGCVT
ncbi:WAV2, partial [Symbiodinium microadriaticum]